MVTSIKISEKTKTELLILKRKLEIQSGKKQTLEDAIQWLIAISNKPSVEERIKLSDSYFGLAKIFRFH